MLANTSKKSKWPDHFTSAHAILVNHLIKRTKGRINKEFYYSFYYREIGCNQEINKNELELTLKRNSILNNKKDNPNENSK